MSEAEEELVVCNPVHGPHRPTTRIKATIKGRCTDCRQEIWLSDSTVRFLARKTQARVICLSCAMEIYAEHPDSEVKKVPLR